MAQTPTPIPTRIPDVPLPGHYECITAQLNLTLQVRSGLAKWILAMRDPSPGRQIELQRMGGNATWERLPDAIMPALQSILDGMTYLAGMPNA